MGRLSCGQTPPKENSIVKGKKKSSLVSYVEGNKANLMPKPKSQSPKMKTGRGK